MGVTGIYFAVVGDQASAEERYNMLKKLAPDYPMTKKLRCVLYPYG